MRFKLIAKFLRPGRVFQRRGIWPAIPTRHRGTGEGNNDRTGACVRARFSFHRKNRA